MEYQASSQISFRQSKSTFHALFIKFTTVELFVQPSNNDYFFVIRASAHLQQKACCNERRIATSDTLYNLQTLQIKILLCWTIPATREIDVLCNPAGNSSCHQALFVNIMIIITLCYKQFVFTKNLCARGDLKTCLQLPCQFFSYGAAAQRGLRPTHS